MIDWDKYEYPQRSAAEWDLEIIKASMKERVELLSDPQATYGRPYRQDAVRASVQADKIRLPTFLRRISGQET